MPHPIWQAGFHLSELVSSSVKEGGDSSSHAGVLRGFKETMNAKVLAWVNTR